LYKYVINAALLMYAVFCCYLSEIGLSAVKFSKSQKLSYGCEGQLSGLIQRRQSTDADLIRNVITTCH